jgi:hypothetical protein
MAGTTATAGMTATVGMPSAAMLEKVRKPYIATILAKGEPAKARKPAQACMPLSDVVNSKDANFSRDKKKQQQEIHAGSQQKEDHRQQQGRQKHQIHLNFNSSKDVSYK